jgi:cytochrome c biogenesis protein CcmG/thiol:disulfide interchange protein DsbE
MENAAKTTNFKRKHLWIVLFSLVSSGLLIFFLFRGLQMDQTKLPSALIDKPAMPFSAAWIQGQEFVPAASGPSFSLADLKGKPVILNFWASWCVSCRQEARDLEYYWQTVGKEKGVQVVGVAIQDTVEAAKEFANSYGKTYILGLDTDGKAAINYGVTGVPETFFIDSKGVIVHKEVGPVSRQLLAEMSQKYF